MKCSRLKVPHSQNGEEPVSLKTQWSYRPLNGISSYEERKSQKLSGDIDLNIIQHKILYLHPLKIAC